MTLEPLVSEWIGTALGAGPRRLFFEARSMSEVWGVELDDGRRVAVKRRQDGGRLATVATAHRAAQAAGIDTPALLAGPDPVGDGLWITVEEWRPEGTTSPDGDAPERYAGLLARLVTALADVPSAGLEPPPWLAYDHGAHGRVWPPASSPRWDPHRIEADLPRALVTLAARARDRLIASPLPAVLGHADLNGLNVRWVGTRPIVHDWDSIASRPEAVLAGTLAVDHVAQPDAGAAAPVVRCARVLDEYSAARGLVWTPDEIEVAWATTVWLACYNAAFEHLHGGPGAVTARILGDGAERLGLAGA